MRHTARRITEIGAGQSRADSEERHRDDNPFLSTGKPMREISEIGARNSESTYKGEVGPPQSPSL